MNRIERSTGAALIAGALIASFAGAQVRSDPPETLREDVLDAPAATSVQDAARAREAASSGHAMDHGTYRQVDAGRDDVAATSPVGAARRESAPDTPAGHGGHGAADPHAGHAMPAASPTPDPHAGHDMPAPTPTPDPHAGHAMPSPSPTPDPHAGHRMPAPSPTPDPHAGHVMPSPSPSPEARR